MDTLDNDDESGVAHDPGYGGNAKRRPLTSERVGQALADTGRDRDPYAHVDYPALAATLAKHGWRKQEHEWRMVTLGAGSPGTERAPALVTGEPGEQSIEWWNRGADFVWVHRWGTGAIVCSPHKTRQAIAARIARRDT